MGSGLIHLCQAGWESSVLEKEQSMKLKFTKIASSHRISEEDENMQKAKVCTLQPGTNLSKRSESYPNLLDQV